MKTTGGNISDRRGKWRWKIAVLLICTGAITLAWWSYASFSQPRDPLFRGKPESEWVHDLKYWDDAQVKEWRTYGEAGVQVLIRGLKRADHPFERAYRKSNRALPLFVTRWLPAPKQDSTQTTRHCLVSLIASLGPDAKSATSVMIRTVNQDESDAVRQSAISFFTSDESDHCYLTQMSLKDKKALLPGLIRALQSPGNWGLRNNAALALRYYPEEKLAVAPALAKALKDPEAHVRLVAAEALLRVDLQTAQRERVTSIIIAITHDPDSQIAARAISALKASRCEPDLAVPVLLNFLQNTNTLLACEAVWALQWSTREFAEYSERIIPALRATAQRKDNVGRYAATALTQWESRPAGKE